MKLSPDVIFRKQLNGKGGDVRVLQHRPTEQVPQQDLKQEVSWEVGKREAGQDDWHGNFVFFLQALTQ